MVNGFDVKITMSNGISNICYLPQIFFTEAT